MASEPAFSTVEAQSGLGGFWRSLSSQSPFGWLGRLWFGTLADTAAAREQVRQAQARFLRLYCVSRFRPFRRAYTYDLMAHEIQRHALPGGQWHREVPFALW